jgi:hypothetical protein
MTSTTNATRPNTIPPITPILGPLLKLNQTMGTMQPAVTDPPQGNVRNGNVNAYKAAERAAKTTISARTRVSKRFPSLLTLYPSASIIWILSGSGSKGRRSLQPSSQPGRTLLPFIANIHNPRI